MKCFVIQPFKEPYNARYKETFAPAIKDSGFEPYRVDEDPSASIPIDDIEAGIKSSDCCFVDISEDNPNVWFELGYAIAMKKHLCLVCSSDRGTKFPFDVQHRSIIKYSNNSAGDFDKLSKDIKLRLNAIKSQIETEGVVSPVDTPVAVPVGEMDNYELACLALIAGEVISTEETVSVQNIKDAMSRAGYTTQATALAMHSLKQSDFIEAFQENAWNGEGYWQFRMTDEGFAQLKSLRSKLTLVKPKGPKEKFSIDLDDEIPF